MVWITRDNYGFWRFVRKDDGGTATYTSNGLPTRDVAMTEAARMFPGEHLHVDGDTHGAGVSQYIPLPNVDPMGEAAAGGYPLPAMASAPGGAPGAAPAPGGDVMAIPAAGGPRPTTGS